MHCSSLEFCLVSKLTCAFYDDLMQGEPLTAPVDSFAAAVALWAAVQPRTLETASSGSATRVHAPTLFCNLPRIVTVPYR